MNVVLVRPEIAPNTGSIIRLCANTGAALHLVEPMGFSLDDRSLRRAGLDYHELADVSVHADVASCRAAIPGRWFALSSRAQRRYDEPTFAVDDTIVFGSERAGLEPDELMRFEPDHRLLIPMQPGNRSLNLANAVAVVVFEGWRQRGFPGSGDVGTSTIEAMGSELFDR